MQGTHDWGDLDAGGAWALLGASTAQAAWYAGFLAIPVALFGVGVASYDLLHAGYLALLIASLLWAAVSSLQPPLTAAILPASQVSPFLSLQPHPF
jgi:hypothetical protein